MAHGEYQFVLFCLKEEFFVLVPFIVFVYFDTFAGII